MKTKRVLLEIDPQFFRPGEVPNLRGNYQKIKNELGWEPETSWEEMLAEMLDYDNALCEKEVQIAKYEYMQLQDIQLPNAKL